MDMLQIGDRVLVSSGRYESVYVFSHRLPRATDRFIAISTQSGMRIVVTPGHFVYVGDKLTRARDVRLGDMLPMEDATLSRVVRVETVMDTGLFNPHTMSGSIVVNGVKASVYTEGLRGDIAHAFLLPLRVAYAFFHVSVSSMEHGFPGNMVYPSAVRV